MTALAGGEGCLGRRPLQQGCGADGITLCVGEVMPRWLRGLYYRANRPGANELINWYKLLWV